MNTDNKSKVDEITKTLIGESHENAMNILESVKKNISRFLILAEKP